MENQKSRIQNQNINYASTFVKLRVSKNCLTGSDKQPFTIKIRQQLRNFGTLVFSTITKHNCRSDTDKANQIAKTNSYLFNVWSVILHPTQIFIFITIRNHLRYTADISAAGIL